MNRLIGSVLLCLLLAGCQEGEGPEEPASQLVRTVPVREGRLHHRLSFHGVLVPVVRRELVPSPRGSVVEHFLGKEGVTGSIPVVGSIF